MVIVKVWGGIGNQLFQYVFGQFIKYKYNQDVYYDDNSFISADKLRKPELYAVDVEIKYNNGFVFSKFRGIKHHILRCLYQLSPKNHYIGEFGDVPSVFESDHIYFFEGYWQDYKYYDWLCQNGHILDIKSREWPKELFALRENIKSSHNSISIHIRRGDYFKPENIKIFGVCDALYFENALNLMNQRIKDGVLFVFSDDLDWVKENIHLPHNAVFVQNYDVSQFAYIELMSLCKHHIISNSSFSWWAAVLNSTPQSIVVSPKRWKLTTEETITLDKWLKI